MNKYIIKACEGNKRQEAKFPFQHSTNITRSETKGRQLFVLTYHLPFIFSMHLAPSFRSLNFTNMTPCGWFSQTCMQKHVNFNNSGLVENGERCNTNNSVSLLRQPSFLLDDSYLYKICNLLLYWNGENFALQKELVISVLQLSSKKLHI
jgi:hypothetical protein